MNTVDRLEYQTRQWGMLSSLTLLSALLVVMTAQLNNLPEMVSRRVTDKIVSLEFRALPPARKAVEEPVVEVANQPSPQVPPSKPVTRPPTPEPVKEIINPEPKPRLKPVVTKRKAVRPIQKTKTREPRRKKAVTAMAAPVPTRREKQEPAPVTAAKPAPEAAVYEQAMLNTVPAALEKAKPSYPRRARRMNITGSVKIRFQVTRDGKVAEIQIIKAVPKGVFEKTVRKAVQTWRFTPGIKNGRKVATWMTTTINFELEQ